MNESQPNEKNDDLVQLVTGVLLTAFAVVAAAVLLTLQVSSVLGR